MYVLLMLIGNPDRGTLKILTGRGVDILNGMV